uniref:E1 ubiquitin-activating enzyme n=1 Tax=Scleropages formosus TaxID=113540 RepID=A0A8C9SEE6_SCLFO
MSQVSDIDESLYSRQLYVLGHEAMHHMKKADVLIAGMRGLGVEIAKNVILAGVKSVTVQDEGIASWEDLSSQFYLEESSIGQNRAQCSLSKLLKLNPYVTVSAHTGPLHENLLAQFQVVVLTNSSLDEQRKIGKYCHSSGIQFITADTKGLCGQIFCDFGEQFEVADWNGVPPVFATIDHISRGNPGIVTCTDKHEFQDGDFVAFSEVLGMTELNSCGQVEIKVLEPYTFSICDTSLFSEYEKGGVATEVKMPKMFHFVTLHDAISNPQMVMTGYGKTNKHHTLHLAFQALHCFVKRAGRLPKPRDQADAKMLLAMMRELKSEAQLELDEDIVRKFAFTAQGNLGPVNSFIGGLAAQEVLKASSRKFTPVQQWLYFDALECLPEEEEEKEEVRLLTEHNFAPTGSRYDGQIAVFGKAFQEKLGKQKYFLVGTGAIGCELLKNFALIGLGAAEDGHITVTDMDSIEKSNLNRQFLFTSEDIGRLKSETAMQAILKMNPSMHITAHQNRVDPESEEVYGNKFFSSLDGVAAALDNLEARVYLDGRCVQHQKPLLEGGTLGTRGHTTVVVPFLTDSYGVPGSSLQKAIPLCTLKNFPYLIEHTLQWARDEFEGLFKQVPENVNQYLTDHEFLQRTLERGEAGALEVLAQLHGSVGSQRPAVWEDCVTWARLRWEILYNNDIRQLLHCFPPHQMTSSGLPFWSGQKKCPHPLTFSPNNATHMDYIIAAANLYAQIYKIKGTRDRNTIREVLEKVHVPSFTPKSGVKIHVTDQDMEKDKENVGEGKQTLHMFLYGNSTTLRMHPIEFEKDDDTNFHMDFIVAASNLRAENYGIPPADRLKSKLVAGRIIPAIATTTAAVAGLMCLELYKLVQGHRRIELYRPAFLNLAVQTCVFYQPLAPQLFTVAGKKYSLWNQFPVQGRCNGQEEMTLKELIEQIKKEHNLEVTHLFYGKALLYSSGSEHQERVSDVVQTVTKVQIPQHQRVLEFYPSFAEDEDCEKVPPIRYQWR